VIGAGVQSFKRGRAPPDTAAMHARCHACHRDLLAAEYEDERIETCPGCAGTFVAHDSLAAVAHDDRVPRSEQERRAALARSLEEPVDVARDALRRCPVCRAAMRRHAYAFSSGVVVDSCEPHGIWLDSGELQAIEAWTEALRHGTSLVEEAPGGDGLRYAPGSVLGLLHALNA
jgi:Zn-finger nucleic acid-binding protein